MWGEDQVLDCSGCHGDAQTLATNAHAKHLRPQYRDRDEAGIGCYECHAVTAVDDDNSLIADRRVHVDRIKQVVMDETDLWGDAGAAAFDADTLTCAGSRCHSDGAASRVLPGTPVFTAPVWTDSATGACGTCHGITQETLTTGIHPKHLSFAQCTTCHVPYGPEHVNGRVEFADGLVFGQTTVCSLCHGSGQTAVGTPPAPIATPVPTPVSTPQAVPVPEPTWEPVPKPRPVPVPIPIKPTLEPPFQGTGG
jgi:predicted CxxxxCH...CXXCH cytochrome family protein